MASNLCTTSSPSCLRAVWRLAVVLRSGVSLIRLLDTGVTHAAASNGEAATAKPHGRPAAGQ
jgi:hypothetical protein